MQMTFAAATLAITACAPSITATSGGPAPAGINMSTTAPNPDPRIGLRAGLMDAGEATWNLRVLSRTPPSKEFLGVTNSDLAFIGPYAIQGSYNGYQVWDISNPMKPVLAKGFVCPASQSDVSVYRNLLFVSGEGKSGRLDCGTGGVKEAVSHDRLLGLRIFDITDIRNPKYVGNVQTCRGSHTHTLLEDPKDKENVYVYISGSSAVRPEAELPGCVGEAPSKNPNSALFRIEVIKVPLANPAAAAIVNSPRIFNDLAAPPMHGEAPDDLAEIEAAKRRGEFIAVIFGETWIVPNNISQTLVDSIAKSHGRTRASAADSAALRTSITSIVSKMFGIDPSETPSGPTQCHDITVYPAIGLGGGACEGYGLLLDISDPANPRRIAAVSDSNFSYWHSATFNNDGTMVLFSDEWGGGGGPKCRATDPKEWGADAIFTIENRRDLKFRSYYKLPVAQTSVENCVAHNGSMIPIPGRDVMIQSWYQGGISLFDWTDASNPREIGFFDRGPVKASEMGNGGSWSVYWYNGVMVSSEIGRGLDIVELMPSGFISQNEIDAAKTVKLDHLNTQGQPHFVWPPSYALARAYADQLERSGGLPAGELAAVRKDLSEAEQSGSGSSLTAVAARVEGGATASRDAAKVRLLASAIRDLAGKR
jgi:hypothetical protein